MGDREKAVKGVVKLLLSYTMEIFLGSMKCQKFNENRHLETMHLARIIPNSLKKCLESTSRNNGHS